MRKGAMVEPIRLTEDEQQLWSQIYSARSQVRPDRNILRATLEPSSRLTQSLLDRGAIPPMRWRYFSDPKFNASGRGKSRLQNFERNGNKGDAIFRHPNFYKYLRYFILGPDLPPETAADFAALADDCQPITSGDQQDFCDLARSEVRRWNMDRGHASEEIFKLCLELGLGEGISYAVRRCIKQMRGV